MLEMQLAGQSLGWKMPCGISGSVDDKQPIRTLRRRVQTYGNWPTNALLRTMSS